MIKKNNPFILALKGIFFVYVPFLLFIFILYRVIFDIDINYATDRIFIYAFITSLAAAINYKHKSREQDIEGFKCIENAITKGRWKVVEQGNNKLLIEPKSDFTFRLFIENKMQITYTEQKALIEGPKLYVDNFAGNLKGRSNLLAERIAVFIIIILLIVLISIPILDDLGFSWEIKTSIHNLLVKNVDIIEIDSDETFVDIVQNSNNYGFAVGNEENIFYVKDSLSLIRTDKNFEDQEYLVQRSSGYSINRLNIAGDWIFYTIGNKLNRMKVDGTQKDTIYNSGVLLDVHLKDNWLYFINFPDGFKVYKMDINGRNLERFLDVKADDIAVYDDRMIFSHEDDGKAYVESINLNGSDRRVELEVEADDLTKWDGYYYFIGHDYGLYRSPIGKNTEPQLLLNKKVSSYVITDGGIYYSLHSEDVGYPGKGVYKTGLDGTGSKLIMDTEWVEGFSKVGDWLLFKSSDNRALPELKRIYLTTGDIEVFD